jgi:hypothetical protein
MNGQFRDTGNIWHTTKTNKTLNTTKKTAKMNNADQAKILGVNPGAHEG